MAGAIALAAVFLVVTIEMIFSSLGAASHNHGGFELVTTQSEMQDLNMNGQSMTRMYSDGSLRYKHRRSRSGSMGRALSHLNIDTQRTLRPMPTIVSTSQDNLIANEAPSPTLSAKSDDSLDLPEESAKLTHDDNIMPSSHVNGHRHRDHHVNFDENDEAGTLDKLQQSQKELLQVMLLEAGILFHSVFIGMALSVTTETFEGLALGARIAAITAFRKGSPKPWFMALAFGTTTPIGQAIGLATHTLYDPASEVGLLMVGVMNSISAGLLLFAGLVNLLAEDFLSDESYKMLRGRKRIKASLCVFFGAFGMAFVGAFA